MFGRLLALALLLGPGLAPFPAQGRPRASKKRAVPAPGPRISKRRADPAPGPRRRKAVPRSRTKELPAPATRCGPLAGADYLVPFFQGLTSLEAGHPAPDVVRILHFGDSHTAADIWTGCVRQHFQARFGDAGPGLLLPVRPWRGYHHAGVKETFSLAWPSFSLRMREGDGLVGLTGGAVTLPEGYTYRLEAPIRAFAVQTLGPPENRPVILLSRPEGLDPCAPLPPLALEEQTLPQAGGQVLRTLTQAPLAMDGVVDLTVSLADTTTRLLGVELLTGRPGVTYEELGLNGAELFDLDKWNPALRRAILAQAAPSLLVLAYGTNDMGRGDLNLEDYRARAAALFTRLAQDSGSPILVVAPVDRGARKRRKLTAIQAGANTVEEALRLAAQDAHCAFWDARTAMGGDGSMARWRRSGLAQKDMVHLSGPGYVRMGNLQFEALMNAYDQFKKRRLVQEP